MRNFFRILFFIICTTLIGLMLYQFFLDPASTMLNKIAVIILAIVFEIIIALDTWFPINHDKF